ncbi:MAG: SusC/RagA family TonB-linked outer membrane protein [Bacteroidota bacterium]
MRKFTLLMVLMMVIGLGVTQAQRVITGKVTSSEDGSGIPGATILVKGTTVGVITDLDGKFSLTVPKDKNTLTISFVGMKAVEFILGASNVVNAELQPDSKALEGVVVTALGISREKKAIGYSVQDVKGEEIVKARESNMINSLTGKVAGVQITNSSGAVGASSRIVLRGVSSLSGNNQPLFVVDGVPISNSDFGGTATDGVNRGSGASDINPNDISSVSVLKGPNAAALYGSRASNGVILITTKSGSGKAMKSKGWGVEFGNSTTWEKPLRLPKYQNSYGQGSGGKFWFVDGAGGGTNDGTDESWGPKLDAGLMIPQYNSPVDANGVRTPTPWVSCPDNVKNFLNTGRTTATNFAISGASETASCRLSFTDFSQSGMIPNTDMIKRTISFGGSANPHPRLNISTSANYIIAKSHNMPGYGYDAQNVFQQFSWQGRQTNYNDLKKYTNADGTKYNWNYNYHNNPYFTLYENLNGMERNRVYGNGKVTYRILDNLTAHVFSGVDYWSNLNTNRVAVGDIDNKMGSYSEDARTFRENNTDFLLMYNTTFAKEYDFNISLGANRMDQYNQDNYTSAGELAVPGVYNVANSRIPIVSTNSHSHKRINSLYYSGQLSWKKGLYFDFTGRKDWSSTLPKDKWGYFYPSFNLSGVFTDLFAIKSDILSYGKVRVGWAKVGSDTDPYQLQPTVQFGSGWNASTKLLNLFVSNALANGQLKPQQNKSLEFGAEFKFFMDLVSLDITYYDTKATDQIIAIPVSATSGYSSKYVNAGEIDNKGLEISLGITPIKAKNSDELNWDINFNYARNRNKVVSLAQGVETYSLGTYWSMQVIAKPGDPYGQLYGYDYKRAPNGQILYLNGVAQQGALKVFGTYQPDWTGGIGNSFTYKQWALSFLVDFHMGGKLYSMTSTWGRYAGVLDETLIGREGGVVGEGMKQDANGNYVVNDVVVTAEEFNHAAFDNNKAGGSVFDASYVKFRELHLGYTFKKFFNTNLKDVNISLIGRNLALLYSKVPHIDPETSFSDGNLQGLEYGQLPSARSIGFSLSFKF